ncbi:hypothetical protein [Thermoflexus sp.]|jgi:hypothetical protein|uniref:hypothetical protein n=1 Tax=Thermoflexus sp. TaxID=1969742 RepID=UPI0026080360|nr:hypothetical protein [Thermoflexus sp.]
MTFNQERQGFHTLRTGFGRIRSDFEKAVARLFAQFDTRIRENRFVVGGALEIILGAAFRACGVKVLHRGATEAFWDLILEGEEGGYSVKSMLKTSATRLINVLGRRPSVQDWQAATLFLIPSGIVYADPALPWWQKNASRVIRVRSDALEISRSRIEEFAQGHPEWIIECSLPAHQARREERIPGRTVSSQLAAQILMEIGGSLFQHLPPLLE